MAKTYVETVALFTYHTPEPAAVSVVSTCPIYASGLLASFTAIPSWVFVVITA